MKDKDAILLENAYKKVFLKETEDLNVGSTNFPQGHGYPNVDNDDKRFEDVVDINHMSNEEGDYLDAKDQLNYPAFVTAYDVTRNFGGHEEGGWWYTQYTPIVSKPVRSYQEALIAAKRLYQSNDLSYRLDGKLQIQIEKIKGVLRVEKPRYE